MCTFQNIKTMLNMMIMGDMELSALDHQHHVFYFFTFVFGWGTWGLVSLKFDVGVWL